MSLMEDYGIRRKRYRVDGIVTKLRQVEVLTVQGRPVAEAIRLIGVMLGAALAKNSASNPLREVMFGNHTFHAGAAMRGV
jgi:hypothetical protein